MTQPSAPYLYPNIPWAPRKSSMWPASHRLGRSTTEGLPPLCLLVKMHILGGNDYSGTLGAPFLYSWQFRNDILHHSNVVNQLLDMDTIDFQLLKEWGMGTTGLHPKDHLFLFLRLLANDLLSKASKYCKEWLLCISGCEIWRRPGSGPSP